MKSLLTSNRSLLFLSGASLFLGVALSLWFRNFDWLSRFGALLICWGILLLARPSIIGKDIKLHVVKAETGLSQLDPAHYQAQGEDLPDWVVEDIASRNAVGVYGPVVCFVGTLVNGFASLLNFPAGFGT